MDIDTKCLSVFKSFISDIIKVFPEYDIKLTDIYGSLLKLETCKIEEQEELKEFLSRVHKLNKKITNKDECIFEEDELLLTDISFKNIWTTNISYKTKETIWKYLQTFCLLSINHQSNKDLQDALSSLSDDKTIEITDKKIASDVKKIKKMTENIQEPIAEEIKNDIVKANPANPANPANSLEEDNPFAQMEQMMQSSEIGKIAQQVSESINMEELLGSGDSDNPMEMFQKLMSGDAMSKIMGSIHTAVNEKVESGELNKDSMVNEAQGLYQNMGSNPLFQAMNQMQGQQSQAQHQPKPSNKTQARLQKKLKEKQKIQVNKVDE
jgi:hypothetical protein